MGSVELGRELGDAGGPLLVGAAATASALPVGLGVLAAAVAAASLLGFGSIRRGASSSELPAERETGNKRTYPQGVLAPYP